MFLVLLVGFFYKLVTVFGLVLYPTVVQNLGLVGLEYHWVFVLTLFGTEIMLVLALLELRTRVYCHKNLIAE